MRSPLIHHVSVINRASEQSFQFYHKVLGLDFILKTVNQDDMEMYHLFFGDTTGRPGTEFSVFEMKQGQTKKFGTNSLERTIFAVPSEASLLFWEKRLHAHGIFNCEIENYDGASILRFEDQDGVQLALRPITKNSVDTYYPNETAHIPIEHAIIGISAIHCRVRYAQASAHSFATLFDVTVARSFEHNGHHITVLTKENTLFDQEIHLIEDRMRNIEENGVGAVQHIALNATTYDELLAIEQKILQKNFHYSGIKNREFFQSLYYREPNNLLIEVATEQINFQKPKINIDTSELSSIPLYLPPFLEERRNFIESRL